MERTQVLVLANGVSVPRKVDDWMTNVHAQAIQYDDLPGIPVERFENRSVLILGAGNAAAETADAVRNHARDIQVLGRFRRPVLMRQSHYVGDLRGRRTTHMDAFNLKSYEGAITLGAKNFVVVPCGPDRDNLGFEGKPPSCIFECIKSPEGVRLAVLTTLTEDNIGLVHAAYDLLGEKHLKTIAQTPQQEGEARVALKLGLSVPAGLTPLLLGEVDRLLSPDLSLEARRLLIRLRDSSIELTHAGASIRGNFCKHAAHILFIRRIPIGKIMMVPDDRRPSLTTQGRSFRSPTTPSSPPRAGRGTRASSTTRSRWT